LDLAGWEFIILAERPSIRTPKNKKLKNEKRQKLKNKEN